MPINKALHQDVASTIDRSSVIGVRKDITMPKTMPISSVFQTKIEFRVGSKIEIGDVAQEGDKINWMVLNQFGESAKTFIQHPEIRDGATVAECKEAMYKPLAIWAHLANGDFDTWSATEHYPVKTFSVGRGLGQALNLGNQTVLTLENGRWKNGEFCDEIQNTYHHEVNHFLLHNVAIYVPSPLQTWIKAVRTNLEKGVGCVEVAIKDAKEAALERNEYYQMDKILATNGLGEIIGEEKAIALEAQHLWVPTAPGGEKMVDLYTIPVGTLFDRIRGGAPDNKAPLVWDPGNPQMLLAFEAMKHAKFVHIRKIG